jgi:metallo-beta-lactamase class B
MIQSAYTQKVIDYQARHASYYRDPSSGYIAPFKIADNLYYVGDRWVCVYLLCSGDQLMLIDSGYPHTLHLLTDSIYRLGFKPDNLRWILHTHEHFDHFGASREFKHLYGCKLAISAAGADALRERPDRALLDWGPNPNAQPPQFDKVLLDGQRFEFGNFSIDCVLTPGHSTGTMSFFFDVTHEQKTYRAGLYGGAGMITVWREHLARYALPQSLPEQFIGSLKKVADEPVELMLANHPRQGRMIEKRERQLKNGQNPFIDAAEWPAFIAQKEHEVQAFMLSDRGT